jgi:acetyltransferase-like isoleucine patch superfamily enzyme
MGLGLRKIINKGYIEYVLLNFSLRRFFLGFDNANRVLRFADKRVVIPILRNNGARVGRGCDIETPLIIHNCVNYQNLTIGNNCHIGKDVFLDLRDRVVLEDNVTISMRTSIITHLDVGKSPLKQHGFHNEQGGVVLKRGCYIGANAVILHSVIVGECSLVGSSALVTQDVPPYTVVGGVPADVIKPIDR